jgi:septal ring factor EnvC (AmiA/AmiB activator)
MKDHFTSFTAEGMQAFGQALAAGNQRRMELLTRSRDHTSAMLAAFRKERRERTLRNTDARRLSMSELKSDVHSLLGRFNLSRKEMARDLQDMARQRREASDAFRNRPSSARPGAPPQPQPQPPPTSASPQPAQAAAEPPNSPARPEAGNKPADAKKRHS